MFAQSKKELIVSLTNRVDSLNQIVSSERSYKDRLNSEVSNLKKQLLNLETTEDRLLNEIKVLEDKNSDLLNEHNKFKKEVEQKLKTKQDSLFLITAELLKYKPAPKEKLVVKQDNTGPIKTVTIGTQVWMAENLKVSKYSDGTTIPNITDNTQWQNNTTGAWAYFNNDAANNAKYGKLYNWYTVSKTSNGNKNVCPTGWHVPTDAEWTVLTDYLGGESVAGGKMKEVGTSNWNYPNTDATNTSLFTGLPGGGRNDNGSYDDIGDYGFWWSSSEFNTYAAWNRYLDTNNGNANSYNSDKRIGLSVRCLRD